MKSIEAKFNEALGAINKAGKQAKFAEQLQPMKEKLGLVPIEVQLSLAEAVLGGKITEAEAARRTIRKHNGAEDNAGYEVFSESGSNTITETDNSQIVVMKEASVERLKAKGMSEAEARGVLGLPEKPPEGLTRLQQAEYISAKRFGFSESDALKLATLAEPVRPHGRSLRVTD